jgi:hypothetical protein
MKNPWMSLWLSGFNRAAGYARGHASAHAARQYQAMMSEGTRQMMRLWTAGLLAAPTTKKPTRRKKLNKR